MEFDESLPSASVFYPHQEVASIVYRPVHDDTSTNASTDGLRYSTINTVGRSSAKQLNTSVRSTSPPPPPPPIIYDSEAKSHDITSIRPKIASSFSTTGIRQSDEKRESFMKGSLYLDDHDQEILLNGSQYWPLQDSIAPPSSYAQSKSITPAAISYRKLPESKPLDDSSTMISTDWTVKTARQQVELDEFEMLERQAQLMVDKNYPIISSSASLSASQSYMRSSSKNMRSSSDEMIHDFHPGVIYDDDIDDEYHDEASNIHTMFETVTSFLGQKYDDHQDDDDHDYNQSLSHQQQHHHQHHHTISSSHHHNMKMPSTSSDRIDDDSPFKPSPRAKVVHSPPRAAVSVNIRESKRWGAVTRPTDDDDSVFSPLQHHHSNSNARTQPLTSSSSVAHHDDNMSDISAASNRHHHTISHQHHDPSASSSFVMTPPSRSSASRPSLSARTLRSRPSIGSATRPLIKPPKNLPIEPTSSSLTNSASSKPMMISGHDNIDHHDEMRSSLASKAKELESELETYKKENTTLRQLRKQQETVLDDIIKQKNDAMMLIAAEKAKMEKIINDEHQAAVKDRRQAAKILRDARGSKDHHPYDSHSSSINPPASIRNARQEIDALSATIEKMKADHDIISKKNKLNERRYQQLVKDQQKSVMMLEERISSMEQEKVMVWMFLDKSDLRIPASLKAQRPEQLQHPSSSNKSSSKLASTGSHISSTSSGRSKNNISSSSSSSSHGLSKTSSAAIDTSLGRSTGVADKNKNRRGYGESFAEEIADLEQLISTQVTSTYYDEHDDDHDDHNVDDEVDETYDDDHKIDDDYDHRDDDGSVDQQDREKVDIGAEMRQSWARSSTSRISSGNHRYSIDEPSNPTTTKQSHMIDNNIVSKHESTTLSAMVSSSSQMRRSSSSTVADTVTKPVDNLHIIPSSSQPTKPSPSTITPPSSPPKPSASTINIMQDAPNNNSSSSSSSYSRSEEVLPDGTTLVRYRNGTTKQVFADGRSIVNFSNGDTKTSDTATGLLIYYYAQAATSHTTYPDGLQVYDFPNGQIEKHYPSGRKEIIFPDKTKKIIYSNGIQESYFPDGVAVREYPDATKEMITDNRN